MSCCLPYSPEWNRTSTSTGYKITYCPDHPRAWSTGYVYTHVLIAEIKVGRLLIDSEVVHHLNGNRLDNRPENIEITTQSKHFSKHLSGKFTAPVVVIKCPECDSLIEKPSYNTHLVKGGLFSTCSKICRGKFSRKIQLLGYTPDINRKISENIVRTYVRPHNSAV